MNGSKTASKKLLALLIIIAIAVGVLASCSTPGTDITPPSNSTKQEIQENINASLEENLKTYKSVSDYLVYWGIPSFNSSKLKSLENVYAKYYNYSEMPSIFDHAVDTAQLFLDEYYNEQIIGDTAAVTNALMTSYVNVLEDPYGVYRVPEEYADYDTDMSGKFGGIGVVVEYNHKEESIMVSSVYIDSPADAAGFKVGDYIVAVEGVPIEEIGYLNAVYKIRGEIGTEITMTVLRGEQRIDLTAVRAEIEEKTVQYEITEENYGYIQVTSFKDNTDEQFAYALAHLTAAEVEGIIFDFRNNLGGYVNTACNMISMIVENGKDIFSYSYKGRPAQVIQSHDDTMPVVDANGVQATDENGKPKYETLDYVLDIPFVVLCNEMTASAAEVFTAAMRDYRVMELLDTTIIGNITYKKGVMQSTFSFTDGSSITLTTAYYNPPSGVNYHGVGITPDVIVENTETEDLQYDAAVEELIKLINANNS